MMSFSDAVRTCLREKYVTFSGRAQRSEYWWFYLFCFLVNLVLQVFSMAVLGMGALTGDPSQINTNPALLAIVGIVAVVVTLGLFLPSIAALVRRFHDRNISGWYILGGIVVAIFSMVALGTIGLVIYFGLAVTAFVITILKGTDGPNNFGPDPLRSSDADVFN